MTNSVCKHIANSAYSTSHLILLPSNYLVVAEPCFGVISSPRCDVFTGLHPPVPLTFPFETI